MTIPYILYKTGPFDTVTQPEIVECFQINEKMLKSKIEYFNDGDCYNFINKHFDANVVKAYDMLIPGAYKADLWRLCVLYIHGGIYGDLTQTFLREYDVNKDNADVIFVMDGFGDNYGIYNAFMAAKKRNGFLKYCIEQIVKQILMRNKGKNALDITGPQALRRHYLTFFRVNRINFGLQTLLGIDNKIYRINVPFRQAEPGMCKKHSTDECCLELNHTCIFLRKTKNHFKLLYNVKATHYDKSIHYGMLYSQNKIFKLDEKEVRKLEERRLEERRLEERRLEERRLEERRLEERRLEERRLQLRNLRMRKRQLQYKMFNMNRLRRRQRLHLNSGNLDHQRGYKKRYMIMK